MNRDRVIYICDRANMALLCAVAYFLPISKAIIEVASIMAIACYLIKKIAQWRDLPPMRINIPVFIYLGICVFSLFISSNLEISLKTFFFKTLQYVAFFFVVADTLNTEKRFRVILTVFFVSSALLGSDGIFQHFTHKDFIRNRPYIVEGRISASVGTPNDFGCYLITLLPFAIAFSFYKFRNILWRFLSAFLSFLLFVCLIMTISKGAWCGFVTSMIFMSIWLPVLALFLAGVILSIIFTRQYYSPNIRYRLDNFFILDASGIKDAGSIERKAIWKIAWKIFIAHPWLGVGLGTFMFNFAELTRKDYPYGVAYAHNCYLQMAAEIGIIGLASFLSILALFFYFGIRALIKNKRTLVWYVLLASLSAILAYSVQMGVDTVFYSVDLGMLFWLILGLGTAAIRNLEKESVAIDMDAA